MKKISVLFLLAVLAAGGASAQSSPKKVLDKATLDKYITDFPPIMQALSDLFPDQEEAEAAASDDNATKPIYIMLRESIAEIKKQPQWRPVLAKYGWNERFWDVYYAVTLSAIIQMAETTPAEYLPAAMKDQLAAGKATVHAADYALVAQNMDRLEDLLSEMDDSQ